MKIFAALLLILFLAFSGYHLSFRSFRLPVFARTFYLTGTEHIFLGLLLGPLFFNLLDFETLSRLEPLTALILGWIGLLCGFQFELNLVRRFSKTYLGAALAESSITFLMVFTASFFLLPYLFSLTDTHKMMTAVTLGASASCSAQTGLAIFSGMHLDKRSDLIRFLQYISSINGISGLIFFLPVFFLDLKLSFKPYPFSGTGYGLLTVLIANIALILLYNLFLSQRRHKKELLIVIVGMVVLTSGAASAMQFSPLLANFFIGIFLVNTSREKERIFSLLVTIEKPLYLLLLVFIGASWRPTAYILIPAALIYTFIRITAKLAGGFSASKISFKKHKFPGRLGYGLIEQGGIPLAILFDFYMGSGGEFRTIIMTIGIIGIIFTDLMSPLFIQRLFKHGENSERSVNG